MRPGPKQTARILVETTPLDLPPTNITDLVSSIITDNGWESNKSSAFEKAELWRDATLETLRLQINQLLEIGRPVRVTFNSSSAYIVQGSCFIEPSDTREIQESKTRRIRSEPILKALSSLTPDQFEFLCGKIIELLGVEKPFVTRRSADEGIDFYGKLKLESILFPNDITSTIQRQLSVWLVGQAKRYISTKSGTSEIRDLVGAVSLGRASVFGSITSPFSEMNIRVADPVFAILITNGFISANAWRLLDRSGVIGMDGEMVAAFLADREVGIESGDFKEDAFIAWLEKT
jgi:hypothetical protein